MIRKQSTKATRFIREPERPECARPGRPRVGNAIVLTILLSFFGLGPSGVDGGDAVPSADPEKGSRVPRWDARGVGRTPRQGVACLDVSEDARLIAVGTVAVLLFLYHYLVRSRWLGKLLNGRRYPIGRAARAAAPPAAQAGAA